MKTKQQSMGTTDDERLSRGRRREDASFPAPPARAGMPENYAAVLSEIKQRIQAGRLHTVMAANSAMVMLYWDIGRLILDRQQAEGWGAKVIDRLSADLSTAFPDMKGLSPRNLMFMRVFASAYPEPEIVKQLVSLLPWGHIIRLLQRIKEPDVRHWYIKASIENGWSRNILELQMGSRAHERLGQAATNFPATLPPADSDMASQIFKDPYLFDFLGTADPRKEREVGQMNLYLSAADDLLRHPDDKPSIGLLLCKGKKKLVVEYALRGFNRPIGVADWETRLTTSLPKELKGSLPSIKEIEAGLNEAVK